MVGSKLSGIYIDGANTFRAINLSAGTYTIVSEDLLNPNGSCRSFATFDVLEDNPVLTLAAANYNKTDKNNCSPDNGTITITSVNEDGLPVTYDPVALAGAPNYIFTWRDALNNPVLSGGVAVTGPSLSGLAAGSYTVTATNALTGCASSPVSILINDITVKPLIT